MVETILVVSSIMMVISFILILAALCFIYKTFKLIVKSLYECNSNIVYIKNKLEEQPPKGKHQKLFEGKNNEFK